MRYSVTKRLNPDKGYPCVYRQHRAESHCRYLHGYDLIFEVTFEADELDENGWVIDFGGLSYLKNAIEKSFDHKTLIADDDPALAWIAQGHEAGFLDVKYMNKIGLEEFACWLAVEATDQLQVLELLHRVRVRSARVFEHAGNMAEYSPEYKND